MFALCPLVWLLGLLLPGSLLAQEMEGTWRTQYTDPDGRFVVVILAVADGRYTIDYGQDDEIDVTGRYQIEGQQVTLWDESGKPGLACPEARGRYQLHATREQLRLTRIEDACPNRGGRDGVIAFVRVRQ